MRLDKFFQITGIIKRRVLANEACKRELARVNGAIAKPTKELQEGDVIELSLPRRRVKVRILKVIPWGNLPRARRDEFIEILEDQPVIPNPDDVWDDSEDGN